MISRETLKTCFYVNPRIIQIIPNNQDLFIHYCKINYGEIIEIAPKSIRVLCWALTEKYYSGDNQMDTEVYPMVFDEEHCYGNARLGLFDDDLDSSFLGIGPYKNESELFETYKHEIERIKREKEVLQNESNIRKFNKRIKGSD